MVVIQDVHAAGRVGRKQEMVAELVVLSHWAETGTGAEGKASMPMKGYFLSRMPRVCSTTQGVNDLIAAPHPCGKVWPALACHLAHQQEPTHLEQRLSSELRQKPFGP